MGAGIRWVGILLAILASPTLANEPDKVAIEAAVQRWVTAFNDEDAEGMASVASEDVLLMDATMPPISGIEAARAAWRRSIPQSDVQLTSTTKDLEVAGDVAWRVAALAQQRSDKSVMSRGQALEVWIRTDGAWKLHRQMSTGILARAPLLRRPNPREPVLDREKN